MRVDHCRNRQGVRGTGHLRLELTIEARAIHAKTTLHFLRRLARLRALLPFCNSFFFRLSSSSSIANNNKIRDFRNHIRGETGSALDIPVKHVTKAPCWVPSVPYLRLPKSLHHLLSPCNWPSAQTLLPPRHACHTVPFAPRKSLSLHAGPPLSKPDWPVGHPDPSLLNCVGCNGKGRGQSFFLENNQLNDRMSSPGRALADPLSLTSLPQVLSTLVSHKSPLSLCLFPCMAFEAVGEPDTETSQDCPRGYASPTRTRR